MKDGKKSPFTGNQRRLQHRTKKEKERDMIHNGDDEEGKEREEIIIKKKSFYETFLRFDILKELFFF